MINTINLNNSLSYINILNSDLIYYIIYEYILTSNDGGEILTEDGNSIVIGN